MLKKLFGRRDVQEASHSLYAAIVAQARQPEFYESCGVPDTVDGRFDMLALHAFLVLRRLGQDGRQSAALSQALFDLMFADMDRCLREMGVSDMGVGKRVKAMATAFYGRVAAYEEGLGDPIKLNAALARNLYRGELVDERHVAAVACYLQEQATALDRQNLDDLRGGKVSFGTPVTL